MCRALAILAMCACLCAMATPASAVPFLSVTADHLGLGVIQYTLNANNDLGGAVAVQVTATTPHTINQVPSFFFPDAAPDGGADVLVSQVNLAQMFDAAYVAAGGQPADSWWDNSVFSTSNPPFNTVVVDAAVGGFVGSTQFSFSAGGGIGSDIAFTRIGQIVILDPAAAVLPLGPTSVSTVGGLAQMDIIDVFGVGPLGFPGESLIAARGLEFSITGSFFASLPGDGNSDNAVDAADYTIWANNFGQAGVGIPGDYNNNGIVDAADYTVWANNFGLIIASGGPSAVPEPSTLTLACFGLVGLLAFGYRRRRRA